MFLFIPLMALHKVLVYHTATVKTNMFNWGI
jgi:hypothetical protein